MKRIFIFMIGLMLFGCSKNYLFTRDNIAISEELKKTDKEDQDIRWQSGVIDKKYNLRTIETLMDSIVDVGLDHIPANVSLDFKPISEQVKKLSQEDKEKYLAEVSERSNKMRYIDSVNLEKAYKIVKKYGFPDYDLRNWKHDSLRTGITTMVTHFDYSSDRGKKMLKLIIKEYKKGRISYGSMNQILWDAQGRNGDVHSFLDDKNIDDVILELEESLK